MNKKILVLSLVAALAFSRCNTNENKQSKDPFGLVNSYKINVPEPSGLSFAADNKALYTVSDKTNMIYKLSLDGKLIEKINTTAEDLEGIVFDNTDTSIWIADERKRNLLNVDLKGKTLKSLNLDIASKKKNSGIEGLTINKNTGNLLCLNEKKPGLLIEADKNGKILKTDNLDFAKDYSGVYHDAQTDNLWIVSDKSMTITRLNTKGKIEYTYQTEIESMEGIVLDTKNRLMYIVSDELEKLFVFKY